MQRFTQLYRELDATTRTNDKVAALVDYFRAAEPADAAWALALLMGNKIPRTVNSRQLRTWLVEITQLPEWLIDECYDAVGDLSETIALLLPAATGKSDLPLATIVEERIVALRGLSDEEQKALVLRTWSELEATERFLWHKLLLGNFRIGVARTLVARALAQVAGIAAEVMAHRLMGHWQPTPADYQSLLSGEGRVDPGQPYPFFLAYALEVEPATLGPIEDWQLEWKWDGIRAQLIRRAGQTLLWTRGEELVTDRYPEIAAIGDALPDGTVLDGEVLAWRGDEPLPFGILQQRIGRKSVGAKLLHTAPVVFMAYDVLELGGEDTRPLPLSERRIKLESLVVGQAVPDSTSADEDNTPLRVGAIRLAELTAFRISPLVTAASWDEVTQLRHAARDNLTEGLMIKKRAAPYGVGRTRGEWWKWKSTPLTIDAVLVYAQQGHGRRASLFTDYTFAVWNEGELAPIAKAYSGLTDAEIREVDRFIRAHTIDRYGPVRTVEPLLVFELHFEGVQLSSRHRAGLAVRFPRIARWRTDKLPKDADTLATLRALAEQQANRANSAPELPPELMEPTKKPRVKKEGVKKENTSKKRPKYDPGQGMLFE
jgi:DNA ligase-1